MSQLSLFEQKELNESTSYQPASHANLIALQENVKRLLMNVIYGPKLQESFAKLSPDGSWVRMWGGLLSSEDGRFFGRILRNLAEMGYRVGWACYGAFAVGANHERERVFIVAYSNGSRLQRFKNSGSIETSKTETAEQFTGFPALEDWDALSSRFVGGKNDGIPNRSHRLKALGNAVCPQQVYPILKAIAEMEAMK